MAEKVTNSQGLCVKGQDMVKYRKPHTAAVSDTALLNSSQYGSIGNTDMNWPNMFLRKWSTEPNQSIDCEVPSKQECSLSDL